MTNQGSYHERGTEGDQVTEIRLVPVNDRLGVYLVGDLAAILDLGAKKNPGSIETGVQITLVAGARKQRESLVVPVVL